MPYSFNGRFRNASGLGKILMTRNCNDFPSSKSPDVIIDDETTFYSYGVET
jgi:hypothetical protein